MTGRTRSAVAIAGMALAGLLASLSGARAAPPGTPVTFADLPGFAADDHRAALAVFRASCAHPASSQAQPPSGLASVCAEALARGAALDDGAARAFFETRFTPYAVAGDAFFTGYYEPVVEGSLVAAPGFPTPLYPMPSGMAAPLPDRAAIEDGALGTLPPLVYLRDPVEAFFVQVQGSARIVLPDGSLRRLVYAGRNGQAYTAIGKILVQTLGIPPEQMGMSQLKAWIRANGEGESEAGAALMRRNRSYIFFRFDDALPSDAGPIGGAGLSLAPLRSLAVDKKAWPYGLPFYIDATMPWAGEPATPFRRVVVAQDTGAGIVGRARGDIFFGTGAEAARLAGAIRHEGALWVLWPNEAKAKPEAAR